VKASAEAAGRHNVHTHLHRSGQRLDLDDGGHDAVVVERLLNYPAAYAGADAPERSALALLKEARRVLAPEGRLAVGAENRRHHSLGLGAIVDTLRKSTPRRDEGLELDLAALGGARRAYRQNLAGYKRMLQAAGFGDVRAFAPLPDGVGPRVVLPLDDRGAQRFLFRQRVRRHSARTRAAAALGELAAATGLLSRTVPFFYLVASR
jgi:hypothetical protein